MQTIVHSAVNHPGIVQPGVKAVRVLAPGKNAGSSVRAFVTSPASAYIEGGCLCTWLF